MNFKLANIIIFILLGLAWITLIIGYGSYWYTNTIKVTDTNGDVTTTQIWMKVNEAKVKVESPQGSFEGTSSIKHGDQDKNSHTVFSISLAFDVIAWVILTVCLFFLLITFAGLLPKIAIPFPAIATLAKFLPLMALFCCFVSMFVFLALPAAMKKDCENNVDPSVPGSDQICEADMYKKFVGSMSGGGSEVKWGPSTSWAAVVVGTALTLFGAVFNVLKGQYEITIG